MRSPIVVLLLAPVIACGGQQPPSNAAAQPGATSAAPAQSSAPAATPPTPTPPPASASADPQAARDAAIAEAAQFGTICAGDDPKCAGSAPKPASNEPLKPGLHEGTPSVNGRLPPEVIRRIVRQGQGRARLCYLDARKANAKLAGRITVKFVIDKDGSVSTASDGGSDIGDDKMIACVVRSFGKLTFPKPESGIVTVSYPLTFAPD